MDFKSTLIKSITAVLCVVAICITMVSAVGNYSNAVIDASKATSGTVNSTDGGSESTDNTSTDDGTIPDDGTVTDDGTVVDDGSATDDSTQADDGATQAPADDKNNAGTATEDKTQAASSEPKTQAEILSYYNSTIAKAVSAKVGYNKSRITDNEKMDGSAALKMMKSLVYQFMGIGAENEYKEAVTKGNWGDRAYLYNSKLTASDITSATCAKSGSNYVITLKLKSGSSSASQSNPTTPANTSLDKCGICVGSEDKGYFDHKTASVIYDAIAGTYAGAEIKESYSNATVKATVNASTGNLVSLVVEWNQSVTLSKLAGMSATATGISHVTYKDFKY